MTDDRQTDHATEKWVAIGEIACAGAILPNNDDDDDDNNNNTKYDNVYVAVIVAQPLREFTGFV